MNKIVGGLRTNGILKKSEKNKPLVTIITVVYNSEAVLEKTIQTVINQSYSNIEYIILDGASTDKTLEIIKKYNDKIDYWCSESDNGIYHAMNKAIKIANGDYLNFLNAGDYLYNNNAIKNLLKEFSSDIDVVYGNIMVVDKKIEDARLLTSMPFTIEKLKKEGTGVVCHQAFFVKKTICPYYNIKYKFKAELNWYFDILEKNNDLKIKHKDVIIVYYSMGGYSDQHYLKDAKELFSLMIARFGYFSIFKYKLIKRFYQLLKIKYKIIYLLNRIISFPKRFTRKVLRKIYKIIKKRL